RRSNMNGSGIRPTTRCTGITRPSVSSFLGLGLEVQTQIVRPGPKSKGDPSFPPERGLHTTIVVRECGLLVHPHRLLLLHRCMRALDVFGREEGEAHVVGPWLLHQWRYRTGSPGM